MLVRFDEPHQEKTWIEGQNRNAEIADIRQIMQQLDPESEADEARRDELKAQLREYRRKNEHEATKGHFEYKDVLNDDGSVMTQGQHFFSLDREGRREYLKTHDIRAEKSETAADGIWLVIDGEEYEPNRFETAVLTTVPPEVLREMREQQVPNAAEWNYLLHGERIPGSENI